MRETTALDVWLTPVVEVNVELIVPMPRAVAKAPVTYLWSSEVKVITPLPSIVPEIS